MEKIVQHRIRGKKTQYLVRWKGFGREDDTWEPESGLQKAKKAIQDYRKLGLRPVQIMEADEELDDSEK